MKNHTEMRIFMGNYSLAEKLAAYIDENIDKDLTLDKIAEEFHYSKFYIARIFQGSTGCTVYKYIQRQRLKEAARKLIETDKAIVEIAYEAHYNSQQAFTLAFRRLYLRTPQEYRREGVRMAA